MAPSSRHPGDSGDSESRFRASRRPRLRGSFDDSAGPEDAETARRRNEAAQRYGTAAPEPTARDDRGRQQGADRGTSESPRRPRMPRREDSGRPTGVGANDAGPRSAAAGGPAAGAPTNSAPAAGEATRRERREADRRRREAESAEATRASRNTGRQAPGNDGPEARRAPRRIRSDSSGIRPPGATGAGAAGAAAAAGAGAVAAGAGAAGSSRQDAEASRGATDSARDTATSSKATTSTRPSQAASGRRGQGTSARASGKERDASARRTTTASRGEPEADGREFSRLVRWTTFGSLIPGLGLIRAGKRIGWLFLFIFLAVIVAGVVAFFAVGPVGIVAQFATNPRVLLVAAIALAIITVVWILLVLGTFRALREKTSLVGGQRPLAAVMVMSLMVIVGAPFAVASGYGFVTRDAVASVFANTGGDSQSAAAMWADKPRVNVFLIGRDNGDDREGTRPDTMLLASIDTQTGASTLISVPRNLAFPQFTEGSDLAAQFPSGFDAFGPEESLINAVWTWGEENPDIVGAPEGVEPGLSATMQAVEGSLGQPIDYYAAVDFKGFEDLIDAMGGVEIDVERPIPMGGGTNMVTGMKNSVFDWIDPGPQTLDGYKALWYVRSREGSDNYDRMCRQQRMIKTTLGQINPSELALAYPKLAGSASENIQTDIPQNSISAFVELAAEMQSQPVKSAQITNDVVETFNPDYDALRTWAAEQVDPEAASQAEESGGDDTVPAEDSGAEDPGAEEQNAEPATPQPEAESETSGEATAEATEPPPGVENTEGQCFPKGYDPEAPIPGYNS